MPKEVESVQAEVGGKTSHRPESLRPRLAGETGFRESRTARKTPPCDKMFSRENTGVMPVPSRTDTLWWHNRNRIRERRLRFNGQEGDAPFRIAGVIFEGPNGPAFPKMRGVNPTVEFLWGSERVCSNRPNDRRNIN
jgi:hypothetical protein